MPDVLIRRTLAALETATPLDESGRRWPFRFCPFPRGLYTFLLRCNGAAAGQRHRISIGTNRVVEDSDTSVGATDGVMPTPHDAPVHQFYANQGDEIKLELQELGNVATTDVMIHANVEPA